jgi:hypothetical protein
MRVSIPELALIGATRAMMGVGIGLLLAGRLGRKQRIAVGSTLLAVGALTTIPLAFEVLGRGRRTPLETGRAGIRSGEAGLEPQPSVGQI